MNLKEIKEIGLIKKKERNQRLGKLEYLFRRLVIDEFSSQMSLRQNNVYIQISEEKTIDILDFSKKDFRIMTEDLGLNIVSPAEIHYKTEVHENFYVIRMFNINETFNALPKDSILKSEIIKELNSKMKDRYKYLMKQRELVSIVLIEDISNAIAMNSTYSYSTFELSELESVPNQKGIKTHELATLVKNILDIDFKDIAVRPIKEKMGADITKFSVTINNINN